MLRLAEQYVICISFAERKSKRNWSSQVCRQSDDMDAPLSDLASPVAETRHKALLHHSQHLSDASRKPFVHLLNLVITHDPSPEIRQVALSLPQCPQQTRLSALSHPHAQTRVAAYETLPDSTSVDIVLAYMARECDPTAIIAALKRLSALYESCVPAQETLLALGEGQSNPFEEHDSFGALRDCVEHFDVNVQYHVVNVLTTLLHPSNTAQYAFNLLQTLLTHAHASVRIHVISRLLHVPTPDFRLAESCVKALLMLYDGTRAERIRADVLSLVKMYACESVSGYGILQFFLERRLYGARIRGGDVCVLDDALTGVVRKNECFARVLDLGRGSDKMWLMRGNTDAMPI